MTIKFIVYSFFVLYFFWPASASEDLGIGDWLTAIDDDTCWMPAHPSSQPDPQEDRKIHQDMYFNIAFQNGSPVALPAWLEVFTQPNNFETYH